MTGGEIIARRDRLKNTRSAFEWRWDRIARLFDPASYGATARPADGAPITQEAYDSTGEQALDILAKFIASEIIPPQRKFFSIKPSAPELENDDEIKEWCEESRDRTITLLQRSNFFTEANLTIKSVAGFGSGSMYWGERIAMPWEKGIGFRGLRFQCDKIGRFLIAQNGNGEVDTNFREFTLSATAADEMFPNAPMGARFKTVLNTPRADEQFAFVHAVYPRAEKGYGAKGFPWASCYVEEQSKEIVDESGFRQFRFACPRWDLVPGEIYGRGQCELAYNSMASKNKARQMTFEATAIKIRPPVFARHDSVIGTLRIRPAGYTAVNTHGMPIQQAIMPWDAGGDLKWVNLEDEKLKQEIRSLLFVDVILQVMEMELKDVNNYTLQKKLELLYWILGPVYGRFYKEFLRATFDPLFLYLYEQGIFSPPPDGLVEAGGSLDIEFDNPMAKVAGVQEINALNMAWQDLAPVIAYQIQTTGKAEITDNYDLDKWAEQVNKIRGVPATVTRSEQEVKAIRDARLQAQQQQNEMDTISQGAEAAGKVAPFLQALRGGKDQQAA